MNSTIRMKLILCFVMLSALSNLGAASEYFYLGKTAEVLRELHSKNKLVASSSQELSFQADINGVACFLVYRMKGDVSVSVLFLVKTNGLNFVDALPKFSVLVRSVLVNCTVAHTSLRLNGVQVLGNKSEIDAPLNYVRIAGGCAEGLEFEAGLDGSFTTLSMESSDVNSLGLTINKGRILPPDQVIPTGTEKGGGF